MFGPDQAKCLEHVSSIKDLRVVEAREVASISGRLRHGKALIFGIEQLEWARRENLKIRHVFATEKALSAVPDWVLSSVPVLIVGDGVAKKISGTSYLVPVLAVAQIPSFAAADPGRLALVMDDVRDLGNIGSLVRTARGFGVKDIWSTTADFDPMSRKAIDASRGLVFSTRFHRMASAAETALSLKAAGYEIVVTSPHAKELQSQVRLSGRPVALVVGNETNGASPPLIAAADRVVQIPMRSVESLNVVVAAGIGIYELGYRLVLMKMTDSIRGTFGREFGATHESIHRLLDQRLREVGQVGADEAIFLMRLACDRTSAIREVEIDTRKAGATLEEFLSRLVDSRYVAVYGTGQDRRIEIRAEGEELLAQLWPIIESTQDRSLAGLSEDDLDRLRAALRMIQENCRSALVT